MPSTKLHHFLLVYSFKEGRLVHQDEFLDADKASAAYTEAEREYKDSLEDFEIVLVGSDNIQTVMRTHGHYFAAEDSSSPFSFSEPVAS